MNSEERAERDRQSAWDDKVLQAVGDLFVANGVDPSFRATRVLVIAEAMSMEGRQTLLTLSTTMPAWVMIGLVEAAGIQARTLLLDNPPLDPREEEA